MRVRMPLRLLELFFGLILVCTPAIAENVTVRGGEHAGFTRITLEFDEDYSGPRSDFVKRERPDEISIFLDQSLIVQNDAFRRIGDSRVKEIKRQLTSGELKISLNCNCEFRSFWSNRRLLVVDILSQGTFDARIQSDRTEETKDPQKLLSDLQARLIDPLPTPPTWNADIPRPLPGLIAETAVAPAQYTKPDIGEHLEISSSDSVADRSHFPAFYFGGNTVLSGNELETNIRTLVGARNFLQQKGDCWKDEDYQIALSSSTNEVLERVGEIRVILFSERDEARWDNAVKLAWSYFSLGLFAEATALQDGGAELGETLVTLLDIAAGRATDTNALSQLNCSLPGRFWMLVAGIKKTDLNELLSDQDVVEYFVELPYPLQAEIFPMLTVTVKDLGRHALLGRLHMLKDGEPVADTEFGEQPEPLVRPPLPYLAGKPILENSSPYNEQRRGQDLEVYLSLEKELKETVFADESWKAAVIGLSASGRFLEAFQLLSEGERHGSQEFTEALSSIGRDLAVNSDPVSFLTFGPRVREAGVEYLNSDVLEAIAERYLNLGALEDVLAATAPESETYTSKIKMLRAEALLGLGQPEAAEFELVGLKSMHAVALRSKVRSEMGDHEFAARIADGPITSNSVLELAWLGGDWTALGQSDDTDIAKVVDVRSQLEKRKLFEPDGSDSIETLDHASSQIDASFKERALWRTLMEDGIKAISQ